MNRLLKNSLLGLTLALGLSTLALAQETQPRQYYQYQDDEGQYRYNDRYNRDYDGYNRDRYDGRNRTDRRVIIRSASEVQREANEFFNVADNLRGYSYLKNDARDVVRAARHLREEMQDGTNPRHFSRDFNNLRNNFRTLQSNFYRTHRMYRNAYALKEFRELEQVWTHFNYTFTDRYYASNAYGPR